MPTQQRFWNELRQWSLVPAGSFSGVLPVANGGTGDSSLTANAVLLGEGAAPVGFATPGTAGRFLRDNGAGLDPSFVAPGPPFARTLLTAATNFYYKPSTGSDANPGTAASPWASPAPLWANYDFGGQAVTLNLLETTATPFAGQSWTGGGQFIFDGGGHSIVSPTDCYVDRGILPGVATVQNVTLKGTTGGAAGINHLAAGNLQIGSGVVFDACGVASFSVGANGAVINIIANTRTIGGAYIWCGAFSGGIVVFAAPFLHSFVGAPTFAGATVFARDSAEIVITSQTFDNGSGGAPTVTGPRFFAGIGSDISVNGAGANYLPGSSAGTTQGNGFYG